MSIPTLPTRQIGKDDVTAIGYGAMGIAAFYGNIDSDEERLKVQSYFLFPLSTSLLNKLSR